MTNIIERFTDKEGNNFWLDTNTLNDFPLPKEDHFNISGNQTLSVEYCYDYEKLTNSVRVHAIHNSFRSTPIPINAKEFVQLLYGVHKSGDTFSSHPRIVQLKTEAKQSLAQEIFYARGLILHGLSLKGTGYIYYDKDVVGVFDSICVDCPSIISEKKFHLKDVISKVDIVEQKKPLVTFVLTNGRKINLTNLDWTKLSEGLLSEYSATITSLPGLLISKDKYTPLPPLETPISEESEAYQYRLSLLASDELESSPIEDRFDDIFDF